MIHEDSPFLEAIALWEEITGVKVPDSEFGMFSSGTWRIRDTYKALREALELDPTEITATLLFDAFVDQYVGEMQVSMADLMEDPESHLATIAKVKRLKALLNRPEVAKQRDAFISGVKAGLASYGALDREDVQKVLNSKDSMAFLRRDALKHVDKLRVDQFLAGDPEPDEVRPIFVRHVQQWWNANSLLKAMAHTPSGVALNLIRTPDPFEAYFCFSIRNGGNLFLLSDVPEYQHPLQASMSRRPDRDLGRRMERSWFPYDLLNIKYDEEDGRLYFEAFSENTGLVVYQGESLPLKPLAELPPHEAIWITMMLDLIVRKFWRKGFQAPKLSYTAEMIQVKDVLLGAARDANLPVGASQVLELPALTLDDVTMPGAELADENAWNDPNKPNTSNGFGKGSARNDWLLERYRPRLREDTINLITRPGQTLALDHKTGAIAPVDPKALAKLNYWDAEKAVKARTELVALPSARFGTPEELDRDRKFLARHNVATQVAKLAREEYEARKEEVTAWYRRKVMANKAAILSWAINGTIWLEDGIENSFSSGYIAGALQRYLDLPGESGLGRERQRRFHSFLRAFDLSIPSKALDWHDLSTRSAGYSLGEWRTVGRGGGYRLCALTGARASTTHVFTPGSSMELAVLCGCTIDKLPDVLQNWTPRKDYVGNHILDRIDPLTWKVENPWTELDLRVNVPLSVSGLLKLKKAGAAIPPLPNIVSERTAMGQWYKGGGVEDELVANAPDA